MSTTKLKSIYFNHKRLITEGMAIKHQMQSALHRPNIPPDVLTYLNDAIANIDKECADLQVKIDMFTRMCPNEIKKWEEEK